MADAIDSTEFTHNVDPFLGEEFIDRNASLPTVIVLNDQLHCGYFIPVSTMAKCGWVNFDSEQLIAHTFRSGETEQGVLITQPRMLVCPKTSLYQYDVLASAEQRTRIVVGLYDSSRKEDPNIKTERLYLVFFLDEKNNPLHTSPLKYAARGVNGATFESERRAFKAELEACHAITNSAPAKPKKDNFHSLGVFCFTTKPELVGDRQKSWCCRVVSHEKPTTENWQQYFVGYTHLKDYAWTALEPGQQIDVLSVPAIDTAVERMALPSRDSSYPPVSDEEAAIGKASLFSPDVEVPAVNVNQTAAQKRTTTVVAEQDNDPDIPF